MKEARTRCLIPARDQLTDIRNGFEMEICLEYLPSNQKEPMIPQRIPTTPWENVVTDLFFGTIAVITGLAETPRLFYVKTLSGNSYRRNRKHILKTEEEQSDLAKFDDFDVKVENNEARPIPVVQPAEVTTSFNHRSTSVDCNHDYRIPSSIPIAD